jgi:hypothetical protein
MKNINGSRFRPQDRGGHYESYFLRANHPSRALSFWIRYTVFSPKGRPQDAIGELWAVIADRERGRNVGVKKELPIAQCTFDRDGLAVRIGDATLDDAALQGSAATGGHEIRWDLHYRGDQKPVLLLPEALYSTALPKAKSLVGLPMARFDGTIHLDGEPIAVEGWIGSQNHNWGARHTDRYAYGQVCGFDNAPDSFLEMASARVKVGPLWTPMMTPIVLRHEGEDVALNSIAQSIRAMAHYEFFRWTFTSGNLRFAVKGEIHATREDFVGLRYYNPPGGEKTCLNSKLATCRLTLLDRKSGARSELVAKHRAAFEILTDDPGHGVAIQT